MFGAVQIVASQIPDFHSIKWLSVIAAIMSFAYSFTGFGLGFAKVIGRCLFLLYQSEDADYAVSDKILSYSPVFLQRICSRKKYHVSHSFVEVPIFFLSF